MDMHFLTYVCSCIHNIPWTILYAYVFLEQCLSVYVIVISAEPWYLELLVFSAFSSGLYMLCLDIVVPKDSVYTKYNSGIGNTCAYI